MATGDHQSLSSAFDDMLKDTRRELDSLYGGAPASAAREAAPQPPRAAPARAAAPASDAERFLNDRYGDGWRQEILERKRDGDEVVVLCKLSIDEHDITKTQFGRARVAGAASAGQVAGSARGLSFSLGGEAGRARPPAADLEAEAYRQAARDALAKCVAML